MQRWWLVTLAVILLGPGVLPADEIIMDDRRYERAFVRNFDGEYLIFTNAEGNSVAKKLRDVAAVYVDSTGGLEDFNRAERARRRGDDSAAAEQYARALGRCRGFWKHLIRARVVQVCDHAGQLDRAVEAYVLLAQSLPDKADAHMPRNISAATPEARARALQTLAPAIAAANGKAAYWQLEVLRLRILELGEHGEAGTVARDIINRLQSDRGAPRYRLQMIAIRVEVKHQQYVAALEHINTALPAAETKYLPELMFLKGQCLYGMAADREAFIRAGLAFMRVVIHHPKSRHSARSVYWAGQVHERIDRPAQALQLYRQCQELADPDDDTAHLAAAAVDRLQPIP